MKRLLRKLWGPSEKEVRSILESLEKKGYIEVHGYNHGEPMYRLTAKGLKAAIEEELQE